MTIIALIIAIAALAVAFAGIVFAYRISNSLHDLPTEEEEKQTVINPFVYDDATGIYHLYGSLFVDGSITCTDKKD